VVDMLFSPFLDTLPLCMMSIIDMGHGVTILADEAPLLNCYVPPCSRQSLTGLLLAFIYAVMNILLQTRSMTDALFPVCGARSS
jgi:hypothetical protein